ITAAVTLMIITHLKLQWEGMNSSSWSQLLTLDGPSTVTAISELVCRVCYTHGIPSSVFVAQEAEQCLCCLQCLMLIEFFKGDEVDLNNSSVTRGHRRLFPSNLLYYYYSILFSWGSREDSFLHKPCVL
ncbi:hypothetical protein OTU49_015060, partial [Cherax quadricarinatus]